MYCPDCGNDAGDAKFCPECGEDLSGVQGTRKGKSTGQAAGKGNGRQGGKAGAGAGGAAAAPAGKGLSPAIIWGGFGALAVVVLVAVVMISGGLGGGDSATPAASTPPVTEVKADITGSYRELVAKGNALYDQGDQAFQSQNFEQGTAYFQAAGTTYEAAWKKQQTDPAVGTDYATSLFYSGAIEGALEQIEKVIAKFPEFQPAQYNLGNYLTHKARIAEQSNEAEAAKADYAGARKAYEATIALDPASDVGKDAAARLKDLPK